MPEKRQHDYEGPDRRLPAEPPGWHLDKKVPLSLIFAMLVQVVVVVWAIAGIKKDVEVLKMQTASETLGQHERDRRQDDQVANSITLVRNDLSVIRGQLDRLLEESRRP